MNDCKYRIAYVRASGKWAELWFGDSYVPGSLFDASCKWEYIHRLKYGHNVDDDTWYKSEETLPGDLSEHVLNHGYVGLWITWPALAGNPTKLECPPELKDMCEGGAA